MEILHDFEILNFFVTDSMTDLLLQDLEELLLQKIDRPKMLLGPYHNHLNCILMVQKPRKCLNQ